VPASATGMSPGSSMHPVALGQPGLHAPHPTTFSPHMHSSMAALNAPGRQPSFSQPMFGASSMPRTALSSTSNAPPLPRAFVAPGRAGVMSSGVAAQQTPIIDLTSTPSPPPPNMPLMPSQIPAQGNLPPDLPLKTPVCIGQLQVTALVLYPIAYLNPSEHGGPDAEWACVRTQYIHDPKKSPASQETIHIKSPNWRNHMGETIMGENFGVVEQKVATALGPMLGKGLIRVEARVRRGRPNVSTLTVDSSVHILISRTAPHPPPGSPRVYTQGQHRCRR
jgi:SWI/SNF-related matrix-associated actin-dependent regulator of chromatin subfamily A3